MFKLALNLLPIVVVGFVYIYWIRPTIRNLPHIREFYDNADGFWQKLLVGIRVQWDGLVGAFLILWPQLPDLLQQVSGLDMSALIPSDWTKIINQGIGLMLVVLRAMNLAATKKLG